AVLAGPEFAGYRMQRCTLHIAVAVGPDFRQSAIGFYKGIVLRHAAIGLDPHHFSMVVIEGLRIIHTRITVAEGDKHIAIRREHNARTKMRRTVELGLLGEHDSNIFQRITFQYAVRDSSAVAFAFFGWLGKREVDAFACCKVRS